MCNRLVFFHLLLRVGAHMRACMLAVHIHPQVHSLKPVGTPLNWHGGLGSWYHPLCQQIPLHMLLANPLSPFGVAAAVVVPAPQANYWDDIKYLKEKIDAGADFIVTQLFYDVDRYLQVRRRESHLQGRGEGCGGQPTAHTGLEESTGCSALWRPCGPINPHVHQVEVSGLFA